MVNLNKTNTVKTLSHLTGEMIIEYYARSEAENTSRFARVLMKITTFTV